MQQVIGSTHLLLWCSFSSFLWVRVQSCCGNFWTGSAWWNYYFLLLTMPQNIFLKWVKGLILWVLQLKWHSISPQLVQHVQKPLNAFNLQEVKSKHHCVTVMTHWVTQLWDDAVYIFYEIMPYSYHLNTQLGCQLCPVMTSKILNSYDLQMNHKRLNTAHRFLIKNM